MTLHSVIHTARSRRRRRLRVRPSSARAGGFPPSPSHAISRPPLSPHGRASAQRPASNGVQTSARPVAARRNARARASRSESALCYFFTCPPSGRRHVYSGPPVKKCAISLAGRGREPRDASRARPALWLRRARVATQRRAGSERWHGARASRAVASLARAWLKPWCRRRATRRTCVAVARSRTRAPARSGPPGRTRCATTRRCAGRAAPRHGGVARVCAACEMWHGTPPSPKPKPAPLSRVVVGPGARRPDARQRPRAVREASSRRAGQQRVARAGARRPPPLATSLVVCYRVGGRRRAAIARRRPAAAKGSLMIIARRRRRSQPPPTAAGRSR